MHRCVGEEEEEEEEEEEGVACLLMPCLFFVEFMCCMRVMYSIEY